MSSSNERNNVVNFFSGKKEYRSLSNFWERDVAIVDSSNERLYESGEHCFHGEKYTRLGHLCNDENRKKELLEYGSRFMKPSVYKTGAIVKRMGGKKGLMLNGEELTLWDELSVEVQREICRYKYEHYEEVRGDLRKSGTKVLIHPALRCSEDKLKKRIWEGKGVVVDGELVVLGKNMLGKIWMDLR